MRLMSWKLLVGIISIGITIALEFVPFETAILIYGVLGATMGAFIRKVNDWARDGITSVVAGVIAGIFIDYIFPPLIEVAVKNSNGIEAFLIKSIPYILKFGLIWATLTSVINKLNVLNKRY
jgi:hypothetical protein